MPTLTLPSPETLFTFTSIIFKDELHLKRVQSLADGATGILHASSLGIHAIGNGLAFAKGLDPKHTTKQIDRTLSNDGIDPDDTDRAWIRHHLAGKSHVFVILDWSDFDKDGQTTLMLALRTHHGRATPLLWKTYLKSELKNNRNDYEDTLLSRFKRFLPEGVRVTVMADRGFFDHRFCQFIKETLGFDYLIRMKKNIRVETEIGAVKAAGAWVEAGGQVKVLRRAKVTGERYEVGAVIVVHDAGMKDPWLLVSSDPLVNGREAVENYGKRFTIEEWFRDLKDLRFGMGMSWGQISEPSRRDRLILMASMASHLLTLLGEAGERCGLGKSFQRRGKIKRRMMSLFNQGCFWYQQIPTMPLEKLKRLMEAFGELLLEYPLYRQALGIKCEIE